MSKIDEVAAEADRLHKEEYPDLYDESELEKKEPEETPAEEKEEAQPEPEKKLEDQEDYKQKYFVLKGKYDAEVPRLLHEVGELKTAVSALQEKKQIPTKDEEPSDDLLSDPAVKYLHDEYPDVYNALVAFESKTSKKKPSVDPTVEERISRVERTQFKTTEDRFIDDLNRLVPDWDSVNKDSKFVEWLNTEDPLTGYTRFQLASIAQNSLDGPRVAKFYSNFKKEVYGDTEQPVEKSSGKKDMSKFVTPSTTRSGATETKQDTDTFTREDINKFYADAAKGAYVGRDAVYNKIEEKINKALMEGKIVG